LRDQRPVVRAIGADKHAAPGLLPRREAEDQPAVDVRGPGPEHGAQQERGLGLERLPEPSIRVDQPRSAKPSIIHGSGPYLVRAGARDASLDSFRTATQVPLLPDA